MLPMMSRTAVILSVISMCFLPAFIIGNGSELLVPDPVFDLAGSEDVPVWHEGDFWNYTTSFTYSGLGVPIPFSGWLNLSVALLSFDPLSGMQPMYISNARGNVSGHLSIPFPPIDEDIYIDLNGYLWTKVQDLSTLRTVLNATVKGTVTSVNGDYPFGYEYTPSLEEYDFPLIAGDAWTVNVSAGAPFGAAGEAVVLEQNMTCGAAEGRTVPAGSFNVLPISVDGAPGLFYNGSVGNTVERIYSFVIDTISLDVPFKLSSYRRSAYKIGLDVVIDSVQPVQAGESFEVSGTATQSNTMISMFFPGGELAGTVPLLIDDLDFRMSLTTPVYPDDTPTMMDHGSFGILVVAGLLDGIEVCTVTTKAADLSVDPSSISVSHSGDGTVDDPFTIDVKAFDPSNFGVGNFSVMLRIEGPSQGAQYWNWSGLSVEAHDELPLSIEFHPLGPGSHNISLTVDPLNDVPEYNESNNDATSTFTVLERPPIVWEAGPVPSDVSVDEGAWIELRASAKRGGDTIPGVWYIDGEVVHQGNVLNITTNHTGNLSNRDTPYIIEYALNASYVFPGEHGSALWNLSVIDVNRYPVIERVSPTLTSVEIWEGDDLTFYARPTDPDDGKVSGAEWYIDGVLVGRVIDLLPDDPVETYEFRFDATYDGNMSSASSPYDLSFRCWDKGGLNASLSWEVNVFDVDRMFQYSASPVPGNYSIPCNGTLNLSVMASDPDGQTVERSWKVMGENASASEWLEVDPAELGMVGGGMAVVTLLLSSGAFTALLRWNITVEPPVEPPVDENVPPIGVIIISPVEGAELLEGDEVVLIANHSDVRNITLTWTLDGTVYMGNHIRISGLAVGNHSVELNASTEGPPAGWVVIDVSFKVVQKGSPIPPDDDGADFSWLLLALLILAILLIIALATAMVLIAKRRTSGDAEQWTMEE